MRSVWQMHFLSTESPDEMMLFHCFSGGAVSVDPFDVRSNSYLFFSWLHGSPHTAFCVLQPLRNGTGETCEVSSGSGTGKEVGITGAQLFSLVSNQRRAPEILWKQAFRLRSSALGHQP